jgi:hypothetical protein
MKTREDRIMSVQMPYSPLDALVDAIPEIHRAGKLRPGDSVLSVHARYAEILKPIIKRIQEEAAAARRAE